MLSLNLKRVRLNAIEREQAHSFSNRAEDAAAARAEWLKVNVRKADVERAQESTNC